MTLVVGVSGDCGHNSAVALFQDGKLLYAEAEERLSGVKGDGTFPFNALTHALSLSKDKDIVFSIASTPLVESSNEVNQEEENYFNTKAEYVADKLQAELFFVDHHKSHARSATYFSNVYKGLILTADGQGGGITTAIWQIDGENLKRLWRATTEEGSLGFFYSAITEYLGYHRLRDEGKVTALAASGCMCSDLNELMSQVIKVNYDNSRLPELCVNGSFINNWQDNEEPLYSDKLKQALKSFNRSDIALAAQKKLEEVVVELLSNFLNEKDPTELAVAGGLFNNVTLNYRLGRLPGVTRFFVTPPMGDEGLAVGAAIDLMIQQAITYAPPKNLYLGSPAKEESLDRLMSKFPEFSLHSNDSDTIIKIIVQLLAQRELVARCSGRGEFGPRALGNRSLLYAPDDESCQEWLNKKLGRNPIMPLCPVVRINDLSDITKTDPDQFSGLESMTIAVPVTSSFAKNCVGATHIDKTARIQVVSKELANQLWCILSEFKRLTGVNSLINTSLNIHGEPICRDLFDALRVLNLAKVDFLIVDENTIIYRNNRATIMRKLSK